MNSLTEMTQVPESEQARRASEDSGTDTRQLAADPEVTERPQRRRFTAEYKLRIVREADACRGDGDVGALLRREGLYSSHLSSWRREREADSSTFLPRLVEGYLEWRGNLWSSAPCGRGPKSELSKRYKFNPWQQHSKRGLCARFRVVNCHREFT